LAIGGSCLHEILAFSLDPFLNGGILKPTIEKWIKTESQYLVKAAPSNGQSPVNAILFFLSIFENPVF
jgi:hypothetical protein